MVLNRVMLVMIWGDEQGEKEAAGGDDGDEEAAATNEGVDDRGGAWVEQVNIIVF